MNGKAKGSEYERVIAKSLSLWISEGRSKDLLWRTACSGGRASTGKANVGFGDIGALGISKEGEQFISTMCAEMKNYQEVSVDRAFFNEKADLIKWWNQVSGEAKKGGLTPMLVAKGNRQPAILVLPFELLNPCLCIGACELSYIILYPLDVVVFKYDEFIEHIKWSNFHGIVSRPPFQSMNIRRASK